MTLTRKKLLAIDFDGVVNSYTSGWQGATLIPDLPTTGAIDFLRAAAKRFNVVIFSSRSAHDGGIAAMKGWLNYHGLPWEWIDDYLTFPTDKPPAHVSIDDRAIQFSGRWPSLDEIDSFQPWYRIENKIDDVRIAMSPTTRLATEVMICLESRKIPTDTKLKALGIAISTIVVSEAESLADLRQKTEWLINRFETSVVDALQIPAIGKHFGTDRDES